MFEQLGIVRRVNGGGTLLWDRRAEAHGHMISRRCDRIEDTEISLDLEGGRRAAARAGFDPHQVGVALSGLCAERAAA